MQVKKAIFALLTSLFVIVMTGFPSYAQSDIGNPSAGCVTVEQLLSPESLQILANQNGYYYDIQGKQAEQVQEGLEQLFGRKAPFAFKRLIVANPEGDPDGLLNVIIFGDDDCLKGVVHVPVAIFLSIGEFPRAPLPVPATPATPAGKI